VSGVLIVLAGFSVSVDAGLWGIAVYVIVQVVDGYLIVPYVARKTVDLAPALVLGAQLLFGALFGLMGLALADPIVAMIKTGARAKVAGGRRTAGALTSPQRRLGSQENLVQTCSEMPASAGMTVAQRPCGGGPIIPCSADCGAMSSSWISKSSVALGGITPPAPAGP
jgi:hypothetical protein